LGCEICLEAAAELAFQLAFPDRVIRFPENDDDSSYLQTEVDGRVRRSEKRHAFSGTV
jgi:hypothetical protein